jgi:hypothetical protein
MRRVAEAVFLVLAAMCWAAKVAVDSGAPPAILTVVLVMAAVAAVAAVVAGGPPARWLDAWRLPLVLIGLAQLPAVYGRLGGDGFEYYVLVRSPLFDHDFDLANDFRGLGARPVVSPQGEITSRVPIGVSLVWLPPLLVVHTVVGLAWLLGAPLRPDGFSAPYQAAVTTATYVYSLLGLAVLEGMLRRYYGAAIALLVTVAIWWATPLFFYALANPSMSHGASAGLATLFVALWLRFRSSERPRDWALIGATGALLSLVRIQDAVLLVLPMLDLAWRRHPGDARRAAALAAGPAVGALLQALVWARLWGGGSFVAELARQGPGFTPHLAWLEVLLSPRHGLFPWTPLYLIACAGWFLWLGRDARLAGYFLLAFALAVAVNASMGDWWGSEAFGARRLLGLTPLFALGLGEVMAFARRHPLLPAAAVLAVLVLWNQGLAYIYNSELVAPRNQALDLERLAPAQVDVLYRGLLETHRLPAALWTLAYDNLKGVWLDEGARSLAGMIDLGSEPAELPLVVGHNWYPPEAEGDTTFRRSKGRRSWLRIPIRTVGDFAATLRLRAELPQLPVTVRIEVNGVEVGQTAAPPVWDEYAFTVPASALHPGLNDLALVYSASPREDLPGHQGKDAAVAVDWLRLQRTSARPR